MVDMLGSSIYCETGSVLQVNQMDAGAAPPQLLQEAAGKACQQWTSRVADRLRECWNLPDRTKLILAAYVKRINEVAAKYPD